MATLFGKSKPTRLHLQYKSIVTSKLWLHSDFHKFGPKNVWKKEKKWISYFQKQGCQIFFLQNHLFTHVELLNTINLVFWLTSLVLLMMRFEKLKKIGKGWKKFKKLATLLGNSDHAWSYLQYQSITTSKTCIYFKFHELGPRNK